MTTYRFNVTGFKIKSGLSASHQQNVYAMWGFGVKLKFMFQNVVWSRGTVRSRSALTFRCAPFLKPPIPHTA